VWPKTLTRIHVAGTVPIRSVRIASCSFFRFSLQTTQHRTLFRDFLRSPLLFPSLSFSLSERQWRSVVPDETRRRRRVARVGIWCWRVHWDSVMGNSDRSFVLWFKSKERERELLLSWYDGWIGGPNGSASAAIRTWVSPNRRVRHFSSSYYSSFFFFSFYLILIRKCGLLHIYITNLESTWFTLISYAYHTILNTLDVGGVRKLLQITKKEKYDFFILTILLY